MRCRWVWTNILGVKPEIHPSEVTATRSSDVTIDTAESYSMNCITTKKNELPVQENERAMEFFPSWTGKPCTAREPDCAANGSVVLNFADYQFTEVGNQNDTIRRQLIGKG